MGGSASVKKILRTYTITGQATGINISNLQPLARTSRVQGPLPVAGQPTAVTAAVKWLGAWARPQTSDLGEEVDGSATVVSLGRARTRDSSRAR